MKIVCASSVALGREAFSTLGDVVVLPEKDIRPETARDADALITRSKVRVDRSLLEGSRLAFVGTATAGTDHFDVDELQRRGIAWSAAPGCNADSVADYVAAALLALARRHGFALENRTIAIIGAGHVGRAVSRRAAALGLRVLLNDPPLFDRTGDPAYEPLDDVLSRADIVSLHVPLTDDGPHATRGMVDSLFFQRLKPGAIFINAARGEVAQSDAIVKALDTDRISHAVLDVFEGEPIGERALLERADLATPHIAGYSYEGRVNGTEMIYQRACRFFEAAPAWTPPSVEGLPVLRASARRRRPDAVLADLALAACDVEADDAAFRAGFGGDEGARARHFESLRRNYRARHEFNRYRVEIEHPTEALARRAAALGFQRLEK